MNRGNQRDFYQKIFEKCEPNLVIQTVEKTQGSQKGDNYTSVLDSVVLKGTIKAPTDTTAPSEWKKSVFCKRLPESEARRETYKSVGLFHNEIAFYKNIYPEFQAFQREHGVRDDDAFTALPKCFYAEDNVLVLEDMRETGYRMQDRKEGLSVEQIKLVLIELAKFHALNLAMKFKEPERFRLQKEQISEGIFRREHKHWYENYYGALTSNAIGMVCDGLPERPKYINKVKDFCKNFFEDFTNLLACETPLSVLCHGDCWTNNLLFSYTPTGELHRTAFIDFQLMRYGSLTLDLAYALYLSVPYQVRRTHKMDLIRFYYDNLVRQLCLYGPLPQELQSRDHLWELIQQDLQRFSKFSLYVGMDMIPIMTCDSEEAPDVYEEEDETTQDDVHVTQAPELGIPVNDLCRLTMVELVVELVDDGLL
ncbi:uncharacterized protein LOC134837176 [Culicoides brevitarsis]|uniref:uncharacterized protein LOC134837176 n=1 Tax=Culicoides brevitarsis TaxID=469753 RepID=UPI00307B9B22